MADCSSTTRSNTINMTNSSQFHMPGAYFDNQHTGVHPDVFRPPAASPSASSSVHLVNPNQPENNTPAALAKRKRHRNEPSREQTPLQEWSDASLNMDGPAAGAGDGGAWRMTRLDTDLNAEYTLGGQLETPGGLSHPNGGGENGRLEDSLYSDSDYRRALGSKRTLAQVETPGGQPTGHPTFLVNPNQQPPSAGWGRAAFNTIGGVVGKVWEFCKAGASFNGFYAGGGTGYAIDAPTSTSALRHGGGDGMDADSYFSLDASTPVPGQFPQSDYMPYAAEVHEAATPEPTPSRPSKRRQISGNTDELQRNWIMVDGLTQHSRPASRTSTRPTGRVTPSRNTRPSLTTGRRISVPVSRLNSTPGGGAVNGTPRRTSHRIAHAGSPALSPREPASFAGARLTRPSSPAPISPSRIPVPVTSQPSGSQPGTNPFASSGPSSAAGHHRAPSRNGNENGVTSPGATTRPSLGHRRATSGASAASPRGQRPKEQEANASPRLSDEAKRLAAKRRREEKDADVRMTDFNVRLAEMIRQGKEALGTKIEVEGGDGEGWEDDN